LSIILGIIIILILLGQSPKKQSDKDIRTFKNVADIMTRQATHAQRLRLLYEKLPVYNAKFFQAMMTCEPFMQPGAKMYVANLMNEYNALIIDIADTMEDFKNDSIEIERLFVEV